MEEVLGQGVRIVGHVSATGVEYEVVIVGIDEDTFKRVREPLG